MHALFRNRPADVENALGRYAGGGSADQPAAVRHTVHAGHGIPHGDYDGPGQAEGSVPVRGSAGGSGDRGRAPKGGAGEIRWRGTGRYLEAARTDLLKGLQSPWA